MKPQTYRARYWPTVMSDVLSHITIVIVSANCERAIIRNVRRMTGQLRQIIAR